MEPISPFLLKRKEKTQNFSFQSRDSFLKKHLIIFFFFQTDFHACLGVESWFLKSMSDWRGQNSWVYLWMHSYFSTCLPAPLLLLLCPIPSFCPTATDWDHPYDTIWKTGVPQPWGTETRSMTVCGGSGYLGQDDMNHIGSKAKNHLLSFLS